MQERCEEIFREVAEKYEFEVHEIGFDKNHAHLSLDLGVRYSVMEVAKLLKGTSGYMLLREFPEVKRKYFWGSGLWGGQVYFYSAGRDADQMRAYVPFGRSPKIPLRGRNQSGNKNKTPEGQTAITQYLT